MASILVVDDDEGVRTSLKDLLEATGETVYTASSGFEGLRILEEVAIDLVILDIMMSEMTGIEVCQRIRSDPFKSKLPILFLTARNRPGDAAKALDAGGDDYLVKPAEVSELPARVRALLRRATGGVLDPMSNTITLHEMILYTDRAEVQIANELIRLTTIEHRLLYYLVSNAGQPMTTERLLQDVWEYPPGTGNPNLVQVHITNLRNKLNLLPDHRLYVRNVRGRGYMISR